MCEETKIAYRVANLTKLYPGSATPVNDDISFEIRQGEIFGLLGENGAGKSTLIRQMVGLLRSSAGTIQLFGEPIYPNRHRASLLVGYMPQQSDALNRLTVGEALFFTAHLRGMSRGDAKRERDRLLESWDLGPLRDRDNALLSAGQRRMLRLAVALAGRPPALVLDEPTNDLDPLRRQHVWKLLQRINLECQVTIVFVTHDAIEAEKVIQRVGIMNKGRVVAVGRPADLKKSLSRDLRVELHFHPDSPPELVGRFRFERRDPDRWILLGEWGEVVKLLQTLSPKQIDYLRVLSPSLEDLYIHYVSNTKAAALPRTVDRPDPY